MNIAMYEGIYHQQTVDGGDRFLLYTELDMQ
jgi:hypothetical protein